MSEPKIVEKFFNFNAPIVKRNYTRRIILHHTGADIDASAEQIHQWHIDAGFCGIGYHFVIRQNGAVERGRPQWAIGAHAYNANNDSVGIQLSGNFNLYQPNNLQIESCANLIAALSKEYRLPIDNLHILGHRDVIATDCPGVLLYELIPEIIGKANWYRFEG